MNIKIIISFTNILLINNDNKYKKELIIIKYFKIKKVNIIK